MEKKVQKNSFKEFVRKFIVSLKRRPHNIALVFMLITYMVYSFNLSNISHTTSTVCKDYMGLSSFVVMLFSLLGMVSFLNAFPVRQKAKLPMVIVMYVIEALVLAFDVLYYVQLVKGIEAAPELFQEGKNTFIYTVQTIILVHIIMLVVSIILIALIPVIGKLLNKINTSIAVEESASVTKIDTADE